MAQPKVGFIGLGIMGKPMSLNLLKAGFQLTVYNRTRKKAEDLAQLGATIANSPREVAQASDVIITMVTDTADVKEVILGPEGVVHGAKEGAVVIDMSTISPQATREIAAELLERGIRMLDAPVSGGDAGAKAGELSIMVGGESKDLEYCFPILEAMGKTITHIGPNGAGQVCKLVNQIIVGLNLFAVTEALVFAAKSEVDPVKVIDAVSGGAAGSWQLSNLGKKMVEGDYAPGFMIDLMQKDLGLVLNESNDLHIPMVGISLVHQLFRKAQADGHGEDGTQALIAVLESVGGVTL